jgi:hypothetical protein
MHDLFAAIAGRLGIQSPSPVVSRQDRIEETPLRSSPMRSSSLSPTSMSSLKSRVRSCGGKRTS